MKNAWESELTALSALTPDKVADAINAMKVQDTVAVYGSFRTLAKLLTRAEYNGLRAAFKTAADKENGEDGFWHTDMVQALLSPGEGGGWDLGDALFVETITTLCSDAKLRDVPGKVAAYVAGKQPTATQKYATVTEGEVEVARGTRQAIQLESEVKRG